MAEQKYSANVKEADIERSSAAIRQDIAQGTENISQTVEQIGERINELLDWRGNVQDSPYWAIGAAAGLGCLAAGIFVPRITPLERFMDSIAGEIHATLGALRAKAAVPGLIKVTLLGIATNAAGRWIKQATATAAANGGNGARRAAGNGSYSSPKVNTSKKNKFKT